jgi:membrane protease YdiL (CAAX protease family)
VPEERVGVDDPARAGRHALYAWATVAALVAGLVHVDVTLPAVGHLGSAIIAVVFLYTPMFVGRIRGEDLVDYGFHAAPVGRGLIHAGVGMLVIFPVFALGYLAFYEIACGHHVFAELVPPGMCKRYDGLAGLHAPELSWKLLEFCAVQLVVVALPEELFFRGFLLRLLEQRFPPKRRVLGGGVGLALVLSALAFALIHLPKDGDPRALATFFPGLLFGWMRSATGSILASTLTHAGSNILVRFLDLTLLR